LKYFWRRKTPDGAGADLEKILRFYADFWGKKKIILVGYSRGAETLPFMANRLSPEISAMIDEIALVGPDLDVDFDIHFDDVIGGHVRKTDLPVFPEVEKLKGKRVTCFYGEEEPVSLCRKLSPDVAVVVPLSGKHHFGGRYQPIADRIMKEAGLAGPENP
jgi:type IV secretory pathway VirJ component